MHLPRNLIAFASVLAVLSSPVAPAQEGKTPSTLGDPWEDRDLSISALDKVLQASQEALKAIPESEKEDSPQGKQRLFLKRRVGLLEELLQILKRREALQEEMRALPDEGALKRDLQALKDRPAPSPPPRPTSKGLEEVQARISLAQRQVEDRNKEEKGLQKRIEETPARILAARNRGTEAEARIGNFTRELPGVKEEADRAVIQERMRNARLEIRLASEAVRLHEEEQAAAKKAAPLIAPAPRPGTKAAQGDRGGARTLPDGPEGKPRGREDGPGKRTSRRRNGRRPRRRRPGRGSWRESRRTSPRSRPNSRSWRRESRRSRSRSRDRRACSRPRETT